MTSPSTGGKLIMSILMVQGASGIAASCAMNATSARPATEKPANQRRRPMRVQVPLIFLGAALLLTGCSPVGKALSKAAKSGVVEEGGLVLGKAAKSGVVKEGGSELDKIFGRLMVQKAVRDWNKASQEDLRLCPVIMSVDTGSIASSVGIRSGDILLEYDGVSLHTEMRSNDVLQSAISAAVGRSNVQVKLSRSGSLVTVAVPGGRLLGIKYKVSR